MRSGKPGPWCGAFKDGGDQEMEPAREGGREMSGHGIIICGNCKSRIAGCRCLDGHDNVIGMGICDACRAKWTPPEAEPVQPSTGSAPFYTTKDEAIAGEFLKSIEPAAPAPPVEAGRRECWVLFDNESNRPGQVCAIDAGPRDFLGHKWIRMVEEPAGPTQDGTRQ